MGVSSLGGSVEVLEQEEASFQPREPQPQRPPALMDRVRQWLPVLLSLIYLVTLAYLARVHTFGTYGTETDFYHYYAPDADRLAVGQFPANPFQGPGYPAVLAVITAVTGDVFVSGKWLSLFSAAGVGLLVFLLFQRLFGYWTGVGAQLLVFVSGLFPSFAIQATTDIFFLLLCLLGLVVLTSDWLSLHWRVGLTAAISSLAYLTRYNGLFLVAVTLFGLVVLNLYQQSWRQRLKLSALFVGVFLLLASPWFYANYKHRGSPLYNTNYLNIATEFYPELVGGTTNQDGTRALSDRFRSFGDVLRYDPKRLVAHYPVNLYESLEKSLNRDLVGRWVGWMALLGLALALLERRTKPVLLILLAGVVYFLLMALNHWETRYYFFILTLYAGLAAYGVTGWLPALRARGWLKQGAFALVPVGLIALLWTNSFAASQKQFTKFLNDHPDEVLAACDYFAQVNVKGARVMARKPHIAYICKQEWIFPPQFESLDEMQLWLQQNPVDYIVIGRREVRSRPNLAPLQKPATAPAWLKPVWEHDKEPFLILYRPEVTASPETR